MKKNKAFTLVELLVVIAIIGVLAAIVVIKVGQAQASSRNSKRVADLSSVSQALYIYWDANKSYPSNPMTTACNFPNSTPNCLTQLVSSGAIPALPADPLGTSAIMPYEYFNYMADSSITAGSIVAGKLENYNDVKPYVSESCRFDSGNPPQNWCSSTVPNAYLCFCLDRK